MAGSVVLSLATISFEKIVRLDYPATCRISTSTTEVLVRFEGAARFRLLCRRPIVMSTDDLVAARRSHHSRSPRLLAEGLVAGASNRFDLSAPAGVLTRRPAAAG